MYSNSVIIFLIVTVFYTVKNTDDRGERHGLGLGPPHFHHLMILKMTNIKVNQHLQNEFISQCQSATVTTMESVLWIKWSPLYNGHGYEVPPKNVSLIM